MSRPARRRRDAGFSLAALIFFATAAAILLTAALPAYQVQARREREEELIFRGEEYMRAIQKFHRRFNAYPPTLEALEEQNGLRFIRRLYTDPTSAENKPFRIIYLNPDGTLRGSTVYSQRINNAPQPGATLPAANFNLGSNPTPNTPQNPGQPPANPGPNPGAAPNPSQQGGGQQQTFGTTGIIGVASDTDETSIKIYNGRQKYNEWEFIAILGQPGNAPQPSPSPGPGANPNQNPNPGGGPAPGPGQGPNPGLGPGLNPGLNPGLGPGIGPGTNPGLNPRR